MAFQSENKSKLVNKVFNDVSHKYDLMNDIMSFGSHRIWKKNLISWIKPSKHSEILDVAAGTGDIAKLCSINTENKCRITCVEPNNKMLLEGKKKLSSLNNVSWVLSSAEKLPFKSESFDFYIISFGLRNVIDINKSLREAHRVLKKGGRFFCLEFSKVENELLKIIYNQYSKIIPSIGNIVIGSKKPYEYLIESIKEYYNQEELAQMIAYNKFCKIEYRNLNNGIAAIHSGWKI